MAERRHSRASVVAGSASSELSRCYRHLLIAPLAAWQEGQQERNRLLLGVAEPDARHGVPPRRRLAATQDDVGGEARPVVDEQLIDGTCAQVAGVGLGGIQERVEQSQHLGAALGSRVHDYIRGPAELVGLRS